MLAQLTTIAKFISSKSEGYHSIVKVILPIVKKLMMDQNTEISTKATEVLANWTEFLSNEDKGKFVLTIVLGNIYNNIRTCT